MIRAFRDWFLDQLAMYAAYHKDRRNRLTHYVGVPLILFSALIVLDWAPLAEPFSAAVLALGALLMLYGVAAPFVGLLSIIICVPLYVAAESVAAMASAPRWTITAGCFVIGWAFQFVGHIFEGRRPAFTVNLLQIFMAPAFLVAELMFSVGLQRDLARVLEARAQKYTGP